jgi:predicted Rossmann fold flavoprotein
MKYDLIVIGGGAAGIMAAITAARDKKIVLLLEKLPNIAAKLKATGGGRCNLTNTLDDEEFMAKFGRDGRFMQDAIKMFNHDDLVEFFKDIGVDTHAPDGFRIFPTSHSSSTIIKALKDEMDSLHVEIKTKQKVQEILHNGTKITGVRTQDSEFYSQNIVLATGGLGYPSLGAEGDGHNMVQKLGHKHTQLSPAMMPLHTKEKWVSKCRADTVAKVEMRVDMKKHKKLRANGDLIFTKNGIRGPVVLDFAREITPLLSKYDEVPILLNLTKGKNQDELHNYLKKNSIYTLLPKALADELLKLSEIDSDNFNYAKISGKQRDKLLNILAWTPLSINGHDGFKMAMITRGGIKLNEIDPKTMQSKLIKGLYFCGELVNLDGPCGGYNLQWSFSSGYLAGKLL